MLPATVRKKVKRLEIRTKKLVDNLFGGEFRTAFRGQGITFSEFREYVAGDDVRAISWPVTARTGKTFIKKFDEEREQTVVLAVDISGSVDFGSGEYLKGEVINHISALLALSASRNRDQVGLLLFSDQVEHFVPPKKGHGHVQRILRDLYYFKPSSHRTRLEPGLRHLQRVLKKRSLVFLLSDFLDEGFEKSLRSLGQKHEVVAISVEDPKERELPDLGLLELQDSETGQWMVIDSSAATVRSAWKLKQEQIHKRRKQMLRQSQVAQIQISAEKDFVPPLVAFFRQRHKR